MARALWSGSISFGLVNVPVKLFRATTSASARAVSFNQLHARCGTRIQMRRHCPRCDIDVPWEEIVKGHEVSRGRHVVVKPEDLPELPAEDKTAIAIESFVPLAAIDPIYFDRSYYVVPDGPPKAYTLLHRALRESGRAAISRMMLRTRSHLALVRTLEKHLLVDTLFYPSEIVNADELPGVATSNQVHLNPREEEAARQLVDSMTATFEPTHYRDDYGEAVQRMIQRKLAGEEVTVSPALAEAPRGEIVDLLAALKKSVEDRVSKSRGESLRPVPPRSKRPREGARPRPRRRRAS